MMLTCFDAATDASQLDCAAFKFRHTLLGHPKLELEALARVIPEMPANQVMYASKRLDVGANFEGTFRDRPAGVTIEDVFETIRHSDSYVMVSSLETHPAFKELYQSLISDVEQLMRKRALKVPAINPKLYLFIASPNSVTPFHIDRYSTFLMQFRGSKQVTVFPQWNDEVVDPAHREAYVIRANTKLPWRGDIDRLGTAFSFAPGEALHIPFVAGHHVKNGPEDISISMSIIFNTPETIRWGHALCFNYLQRKAVGRLGLAPKPVGISSFRDSAKEMVWQGYCKTRGLNPD